MRGLGRLRLDARLGTQAGHAPGFGLAAGDAWLGLDAQVGFFIFFKSLM